MQIQPILDVPVAGSALPKLGLNVFISETIVAGDVMALDLSTTTYGTVHAVKADANDGTKQIVLGAATGPGASGDVITVQCGGYQTGVKMTGIIAGGSYLVLSTTAATLAVWSADAALVNIVGQVHTDPNNTGTGALIWRLGHGLGHPIQ